MAGCQKPISYSLHLSGIVTAEVVDAQTKAPLAKGGCLGTAEAGGFRRQSLRNFLPIPSSLFPKKPSPFHMGSYFGKVPAVESLSHGYAVPAPFGKGAFLCPVSLLRCRIGHRQSPAGTTSSANNQLVARWLPQSPAVTAPSRRELWAAALPHWICGNWKCQL